MRDRATMALCCFLWLLPGSLAQEAPGDPGNGSTSLADLEAFVDGVISSTMKKDHLPGVTVAIVKDGELVLLKGYGLAGIDPERPVDPERSLFRIGSISKTFGWTALMQLQERGLLSLDDPVNDHLPDDLDIPLEGFDEPIRIRHLMSHTPGFEDTALGHLFAKDEERLLPLHDYLARFRPGRVREPGDHTTYSNYGAALAGYIVARTAGIDFETYVEENIYGPLGMSHSTFREPYEGPVAEGLPAPMSDELTADVTQGLAWEGGTWEPQEYELITPVGPAGAMSSTAADMARYMVAHLAGGELEGERILSAESAEAMQRTLFANAEGMSGLAHGFLQYALPGRYENFGHGGATLQFLSNMVMVPELGLGVFVSTNGGNGRNFVMAFPELIIGRYFAREDPWPEPPADFAERGEKYAGTYLNTRRSYTLLEKVTSLQSLTSVSVTDDGYLITSRGGDTVRWVEVRPHLFREVHGDRVLAFREDAGGRVTHIFHSFGITAGERIGFFGGPIWFWASFLLGLIAAIGMVGGAWLRRRRETRQTRAERLAGRLMAVLGALWIGFFVSFGAAFAHAVSLGNDVIYDFPTGPIVLALWILLVAAALTIFCVASLYPAWRYGSWPLWRRLRHTLAVLILFALVLTLNHWNLVGFRYF